MTYPKMKACPTCKTDKRIAVYTYESGWSRVECDGCSYIGSCEGRKLDAIRVHNASATSDASPDRCQVCGEPADLRCAPSRFGNETWACKDCWGPDSSPEQHSLPGHEETQDALNSLTIRSVTRPLREGDAS